jgi:hypothetical protein
MPVHPETMEISFKSKLYSSVFWNSTQLGMLHSNEESNTGLENIFVFLAAKFKNKNFLCKSIIRLPAS